MSPTFIWFLVAFFAFDAIITIWIVKRYLNKLNSLKVGNLTKCAVCGFELPLLNALLQSQTCPNCNSKLDRSGKPIP